MNEITKNISKQMLKELLAKCTKSQKIIFKRMYSKNMELSVNEVVDKMTDYEKIDKALTRVEKTVQNNKDEHFFSK